jgi:tRNA pseudouridine55 synthase
MPLLGIVNVKKPSGSTSRAVVDHVEQLARPARVGHAGTLDPLATGVLVVCVGRATRLIQYVQRMPKQYRATFLLGRRSNTDDVEGDVIEIPRAPKPTRAMLDQALSRLVGEIQQQPPVYSAVKIAGRRAYELARRGETVTLASRTVTIYRLAAVRYEYPELALDIECGSGTYVRALGRDLAAALGTGAVMSALERKAVGRFHVDDAVTLDELTAESLPQHLQPAIIAVSDLPRIELTEAQQTDVKNGRPIAVAGLNVPTSEELAAVNAGGQLVAILREKQVGQLWPAKNFL